MKRSKEGDKIRVIAKVDVKPLVDAFGEIQTDEVVITDERIEHIIERHREDYELFWKNVSSIVTKPDIILKDCKNQGTVFMVKRLYDTNINVVVRVALSMDKKGLKNSIMTFYRLRDKNLQKMLIKNEVLYKRT